MRILTGIDLPFSPSCGSLILADDLYSNISRKDKVRFLSLCSDEGKKWSKMKDIHLLKIKKQTEEEKFERYVEKLSKEIKRHIKIFKPDIIHIQHLSFGMAIAFAKIKLPKIAICHGTGILFALNSKFHKKNVEKVIKASSKTIFPTKSMYEDSEKLLPILKNFDTEILPWGIPDEACCLNHIKSNWSRNEYRLLYAGRLTENKGVEDIIKALSILDRHVTLTIIGDGERSEALIKLIDDLDLRNRIKIFPFQSRKKLWERFRNFDTCIISTKKIEAFCLVAIEAQAHGLPVIYSDIGGMKDVIQKSGIMFKAGDYKDLAKKIKKLMFNFSLLNKYSRMGVRNAKKYKISKFKKSIFDISKKVLKMNNSVK